MIFVSDNDGCHCFAAESGTDSLVCRDSYLLVGLGGKPVGVYDGKIFRVV